MKKIALIICCLLSLSATRAQTVINMQKQNGVFVMPCKVNGLALKFIFDTGASDVSISLTEALFMLKNGYLAESDLIGTQYYQLANGKISEGTKINIKKIEIGTLVLYNIKASILHNLSAPLLLGQSALSKLGKIEFDYSKNTLTIAGGPLNTVADNSNSTAADNSNSSTPKFLVLEGTNLYPDKNGFGNYIIHVNRGTYFELLDKNTGTNYWYGKYNGFTGYVIKAAFGE